MTEEAYDQEILAEFLDNEGAVFSNIAANLTPAQYDADGEYWHDGQDHQGHTIIAASDWGKANDYTVHSIGCIECAREIALYRSRHYEYTYQRALLETAVKRWNIQSVLPERNSIGEPNIEMLIESGINIESGPDGKAGFNTTSSSKPGLIEGLKLSLQQVEYKYLDIPLATAEMEAYEQKVNNMGRSTYSAPDGMHDDTVIARALLRYLSHSFTPLFYW
jgi:hypothetical protein